MIALIKIQMVEKDEIVLPSSSSTDKKYDLVFEMDSRSDQITWSAASRILEDASSIDISLVGIGEEGVAKTLMFIDKVYRAAKLNSLNYIDVNESLKNKCLRFSSHPD